MPLTNLTCPICLGTLTPKTAVPEGTRIRCPKCKGSFTAEAEPKPMAPEAEPLPAPPEQANPEYAQEAMPEPAALDESVVPADMVLEEILPPRPRPPARRDDDYDRPRRRERDDYDEPERDRPRRRRRAKGAPLWVWLVSGGVGLVLLLGCCGIGGVIGWTMLSGWNVSLDNYNRIQPHMTLDQVEAILGRPTDSVGFGGSLNETWRSGEYYINVNFLNGRAMVKMCHVPSGGGPVTRTDLLGP